MRFAEFFAGIGLVRLGLEKSGWECAFANDIDPKKLQMYEAHFGDAASHFVLGDIRRVDATALPEIDLATASFPCTDLSIAGGRAGLLGKNSSALWPFLEVLQMIERDRPCLVLLENVPGFLTSRDGADFKSALVSLNWLGYSVDAFILDALNFVPQSRQRLFVVGMYEPNFVQSETADTPRPLPSHLRPNGLTTFISSNPNIKWKLRKLPNPPDLKGKLIDILEKLPDDAPQWWSTERASRLLEQMSPKHRETAERMIASKEDSVGTIFRRVRKGTTMAELRVDGIAGCLRTPKGGSGRQIVFVAGRGKYRARLLTPTECARLMGADDYRITVPANQALYGFGDAVCVHAIDWIARNYLNPFYSEHKGRDKTPPEVALG